MARAAVAPLVALAPLVAYDGSAFCAINGVVEDQRMASGEHDRQWIPAETEHVASRGAATAVVQGAAVAGAVARGVSLLIYDRDGGRIAQLRPGQSLTVGREPPADIQLRDSTVSRQHARFELIEDAVWVEDLGSSNGTSVNGTRIQRGIVGPEDEVLLGTVSVVISLPAENAFYRIRSHEAFLAAVEKEIVRSRQYERKLALVVIRNPEKELGSIARWCQGIGGMLRPFDCMGIYGFNTVELLLPELGEDEAQALAQKILEDLSASTHLCCGIAAFPQAGLTLDSLIEASCAAVQRATAAAPVQVAPTQSLRSLPSSPGSPDEEVPQLIAHGEAMRAVATAARRLAETTICVIIQGETGAGKEVVARAIHEQGPRRRFKMCSVNCGAIPEQLLESVLFGHERGAFTGAHKPTKGVFEAANGGTLLLDEIGELPLPAQTALLRVLETKRVTRVGATSEIPVDVRILAATHQDLGQMCERGLFRWDLYYRLNGMSIRVPPLREHPEDIPELVRFFIGQANRANHCCVPSVSADALALLQSYSWPGNVRELKNTIERAVVLAHTNELTAEDLPDIMRGAQPAPLGDAASMTDADADAPSAPGAQPVFRPFERLPDEQLDFRIIVDEHMRRVESALIAEALQRTANSQTEAARLLRLPLRTLVRKIQTHRLGRR